MGPIPSFPVLGPHVFLVLLEGQFSHPVLALVTVSGWPQVVSDRRWDSFNVSERACLLHCVRCHLLQAK